MAFIDVLKDFTKQQINDKLQVMDLKVTSINEDNYSCTAENGVFKFENISIRALNTNDKQGIIAIPVINSYVTVLIIDRNQAMILKYSEIDKIIIKSSKVYLNDEDETETERMVFGDTLISVLENILGYVKNHQHQTIGSGAPNQTVVATPTMVSLIADIETEISNLSNMLSNKNYIG